MMGMDTHIAGFRPPDNKWKEMKEIWDSCDKANIEPPEEVNKFFNDEPPDEDGVEVEIENTEAVQDWADEDREGFQVEISKLPKDLKYIRFYNSW